MKLFAALVSLCFVASSPTHAEQNPMQTPNDIRLVAPALEKYAEGPLAELWQRPGLPPRDRSIVTLAAMVARNQIADLPEYLRRALDNGVKPRELSEIVTHLAFYSGWANAMGAVPAAKAVFAERGIGADQLPQVSPPPLRLDEEAETQREKSVGAQFGAVSPGVVHYTTVLLFRDLWLRPDLAPRDRSLVTISALIASGQVAQLAAHLHRAMNNGLTAEEAGETLTQLAFYSGWPNVFTAMPIVKDVIAKRLD